MKSNDTGIMLPKRGDFGSSAWRSAPVLLTTIACAILLIFSVPRIDFHADEAIYLSAVPINVSNDSGLVYHLAYLAASLGSPTPLVARWTSLFFGVILIVSMTRILQLTVPGRSRLLAGLVPLTIVVSYQGIFSILRVRPEISWIAMTGVVCWCLAELRARDTNSLRTALLVALFLLPMNHMLSLFACVFVGFYLVCFARARHGIGFTTLALAMMAAGLVANRAIRTSIVLGQPQFLPPVGAPSVGDRPGPISFLWNVFWNSPNFLNDSAVTANVWSYLLPANISHLASHCLIATAIWAIALPLPFFMKSWESRFVAAVPLLTLGLFYASGYFNPTYAPLLVVYAVALCTFVFASHTGWHPQRVAAGAVLVLTMLNGVSFLSTRVLNHGPATFFSVESQIRSKIASMPKDSTIAVAERFQSVVSHHPGRKLILFKHELPRQVDMMVLDSYDFDMYRLVPEFVPEYEARRATIEARLAEFSQEAQYDEPVYEQEILFNDARENVSIASTQGSWFFRNSVKYRVWILDESEVVTRIADRAVNVSAASASR